MSLFSSRLRATTGAVTYPVRDIMTRAGFDYHTSSIHRSIWLQRLSATFRSQTLSTVSKKVEGGDSTNDEYSLRRRSGMKNLGVVAHVDHGKTTVSLPSLDLYSSFLLHRSFIHAAM